MINLKPSQKHQSSFSKHSKFPTQSKREKKKARKFERIKKIQSAFQRSLRKYCSDLSFEQIGYTCYYASSSFVIYRSTIRMLVTNNTISDFIKEQFRVQSSSGKICHRIPDLTAKWYYRLTYEWPTFYNEKGGYGPEIFVSLLLSSNIMVYNFDSDANMILNWYNKWPVPTIPDLDNINWTQTVNDARRLSGIEDLDYNSLFEFIFNLKEQQLDQRKPDPRFLSSIANTVTSEFDFEIANNKPGVITETIELSNFSVKHLWSYIIEAEKYLSSHFIGALLNYSFDDGNTSGNHVVGIMRCFYKLKLCNSGIDTPKRCQWFDDSFLNKVASSNVYGFENAKWESITLIYMTGSPSIPIPVSEWSHNSFYNLTNKQWNYVKQIEEYEPFITSVLNNHRY